MSFILYLKWELMSLFMIICRVFPIKKNKVFFLSYYGSNCNDNPRAIYDVLKNHNGLELVWGVAEKKEYDVARTVFMSSFTYLYDLATSKVWIDNCRKTSWVRKRKGQYYIQTWHGNIGNKRVEQAAEESLVPEYIKRAKRDATYTDLMLSGSGFFSDLIKKYFWYKGEILECGTPRLDILFKDHSAITMGVKDELNIPNGAKIVLYVPTFRKDYRTDCYDLDVDLLVNALEKRTNKQWVFLRRMHPNFAIHSGKNLSLKNEIDVTNYTDPYKLVVASDLIITDYSSIGFEAAIVKKPVIQFVCDLNEYLEDRGFYFNPLDLPFPLARTSQELVSIVNSFDILQYYEQLDIFLNKLDIKEDGTASNKVAQKILEITNGKDVSNEDSY